MSIFDKNIENKLPIESVFKDMKHDIEALLQLWNWDFWYTGIDHDVSYMESTLLNQISSAYAPMFEKSNLDPNNLFIHVYKNKHGFTGYDIKVDVNYYSPEFCGGLLSTTYDFKFTHPGQA
jgi:hypothetical protein